MKKLESSLKNMVIVLTAITVIATGLLAYVNQLTAGPIAEANAKALSDAIAVVVPGFDNNPAEAPETIELDGATYKIYKATKGGEFIGAAVESSANGFGGALSVLVGFDKEGNIIDYSLLSHAETPGLGSKAADWFKKGAKGDITGMNPGQGALVVRDRHIVVRMWMALVVQLSKCLKLLPKMLLPAMLNVKETRHVSRFVTLQPARLFVAINVILLTAIRQTAKK